MSHSPLAKKGALMRFGNEDRSFGRGANSVNLPYSSPIAGGRLSNDATSTRPWKTARRNSDPPNMEALGVFMVESVCAFALYLITSGSCSVSAVRLLVAPRPSCCRWEHCSSGTSPYRYPIQAHLPAIASPACQKSGIPHGLQRVLGFGSGGVLFFSPGIYCAAWPTAESPQREGPMI